MTKPSWLYWVVAVLAVLWGIFNIFDFWITSSGNEAYLKEFGPEMVAWIKGFPFWRTAIWFAGAASTLIAAILMAARRRAAGPAFLFGLVMLVGGFVGHDLVLANGVAMYGTTGLVFSVILIAVQTFFWRYAARAARKGYLR